MQSLLLPLLALAGIFGCHAKILEFELQDAELNEAELAPVDGKSAPHMPLTFSQQLQVNGTLGLGTPPQILGFEFYTDIVDMFVGKDGFDPKESKSYKVLQRDACISYTNWDMQSVELCGEKAKDVLRLCDWAVPCRRSQSLEKTWIIPCSSIDWIIPSQVFLYAKRQGRGCKNPYPNASIGFGFQRRGRLGVSSVMSNLWNSGQLTHNMISFWYKPARRCASKRSVGSLYIGGINWKRVGGPFQNQSVILQHRNHWGVEITNFAVNGQSLGYDGIAAISTSTQFIVVPQVVFDIILGSFWIPAERIITYDTGMRVYTYLCQEAPKFPTVTITLGSSTYTLSGDQLSIRTGTKYCFFAIAGYDVPRRRGPGWILGASFLKEKYTVFDYASQTVSIAPLNDPPTCGK